MKTPHLIALSGLVLVACSTKEPLNLGSVHVKSGMITAAAGGTLEVADGEHDDLARTRIVIAAGALAADTVITIGVGPADLSDDEGDAAGPSVTFGPAGTAFGTAAIVTLPWTGDWDEDLARVWVREADGTGRVILADAITHDAAAGTISDEGTAEGFVSSLWLSGQHGEIEITIEDLVVRSRKKGTEQVLKGTFVLQGRSGDYEGIYVTGSAEGTCKLSWSATPQGRVDYQDIDWHFAGSL